MKQKCFAEITALRRFERFEPAVFILKTEVTEDIFTKWYTIIAKSAKLMMMMMK